MYKIDTQELLNECSLTEIPDEWKLDPVDKANWVAALRSGKYRQTMSVLRRRTISTGNESFCCLGVWCDLRDHTGWQEYDTDTIRYAPGRHAHSITFGWNDGYVDLKADDTDVPGINGEILQFLVTANDGGASFDAIADWIEANL